MTSRTAISDGTYEALLEKMKTIPPLAIGPNSFQLEFEPLTLAISEKAKRELRETPEIVNQALTEIREYVKGEPDLKVPDDDFFFAKFLRPCKWHAKPAFGLIKRCYHFRLKNPRYCKDLLPKNEREIFTSGVLTPLPLRAKDGSRIVIVHGGKVWKPKEVTLEQIFRGIIMILDAALMEPSTQVCGVRVICDMDGLSLSQVSYFTPSFAAAFLEWIQRCVPVRLKGVHVVNQPFIFKMVFTIFKPFIEEKLRKRLLFHGTDKEGLKSHIGAQALPKKYGGDLEFPSNPLGESLWNYVCQFNEEAEKTNGFGYVK